jgi:hypothetical protein
VNDEQREAIQRILGDDVEIIRLPIPQRTDEMMESFRRFSAARHGVPIEQTEIVEDCYLIDPETGEQIPWFAVRVRR